MQLQDWSGHLPAAFALGLFGGAHCAGMCGGIVAAVSLGPAGGTPSVPVVAGYNLGRVGSYSIAGVLAGGVGAAFAAGAEIVGVRMAVLVLAQVMVILAGLMLAGQGRLLLALERVAGGAWRTLAPAAKRLTAPSGFAQSVAMGAVWGWIPCGLVYGALAIALAGGDAVTGALIMMAFGAGTLPAMILLGIGARGLRAGLARPVLRQIAGGAIVFTGLVGLARIPGLAERITEGLVCLVQAPGPLTAA